MTEVNVNNKTIFEGDNLDIMRGINSNSIDMIYLDPPFNSNRNYEAPIGSEAAGAAFKDTWELTDIDNAWHGEIADKNPALYRAIDAAELTHGKGMKSYLIMMAVRLLEMKRILKDNGSIYLHCDDSADYYLRMIMDAIFGASTYQATISRKRTSAHNNKVYGRITDTIYIYGEKPYDVFMDFDPEYIKKNYSNKDKRGFWASDNLTGPGNSNGESSIPWNGYDPGHVSRGWAVPKTSKYAKYIEQKFIPGYTQIKGVHDRLNALNQADLIHWTRNGVPRLKRYLMPNQKQMVSNIWTDCKDNQITGYPTEKSLKALQRIIESGSKEGDIVLDPFCGCATTCIAAEQLGRRWIGIDISPKAAELVQSRARKELRMFNGLEDLTHSKRVPIRTDVKSQINYRTIKHQLYGKQDGMCKACKVHFPFRNMTIDHIDPTSKGGQEIPENMQLLCGACNSVKGNRTQDYLMEYLKNNGIID